MSINQVIIDEAGSGETADAAPTSIYSFAVPQDSSGYYRSIVCARRVSDGAAKQFTIDVGFRRVAGNAQITNYAVNGFGTLVIDAYPDVNGQNIDVVVVGLANNGVEWSCVSRGICTQHVTP